MMDREQHNGYTNYSTWAVCAWLDNTQALQRHARSVVERIVTEPVAADDPVWGTAAQALKDWVESRLPASLPSPAAELMNAGKSDVDWLEVAATRLDEGDPRARTVKPRDLYVVTIDLDNPALSVGGDLSTFRVAATLRQLANLWEGSDFAQGGAPVYNYQGLEIARTERTGNSA